MAHLKQITNLDFDGIKSDLKEFLSNQTEFNGFDFEGSSISVLVDLLAYATHYMSLQANMSINEMFLETASLRNSIIAKAKELNYVPRSQSAAQAVISLSITDATNPNDILIPKGTVFSSEKDSEVYLFTTVEDQSLTLNSGSTYDGDIVVFQGEYVETNFKVNSIGSNGIISDKFVIQDSNIDTNHLSVGVADTSQSPYFSWSKQDDVTKIGSNENIYHIQEANYGLFEIYFGGDLIGAQPEKNSLIKSTYLITGGTKGNLINNFSITADVFVNNRIYSSTDINQSLTVKTKSYGGRDRESIEEIKLLAPRYFESQNRAVTVDDYRIILANKFSFIETMNVWGGDENVPPEYGKVFIAIKPFYGTSLAPITREQILYELKNYNVVGIVPELIEPAFVYVNIEGEVKWDKLKTDPGQSNLIEDVRAGLTARIDSLSKEFGDGLYFSQMSSYLDNIDKSVVGNLTYFTLSQKIKVSSSIALSYELKFGNKIKQKSLLSTWIDNAGRLISLEESSGVINKYANGNLILSNAGTIDHENGIIFLTKFVSEAEINSEIEIKITPEIQDINSVRQSLLVSGDMSKLNFIDISKFKG